MQPPYSYRDDPGVPAFPDDLPVVVYDGVCGMCSAFVRLLLSVDGAAERHRFVAAQSPLGEALYRHYGHVSEGYDTFLVLIGGRCLVKADAVLTTFAELGMPWSLLARAGRLVPIRWSDAAYDLIAKNRYRIWGRLDTCPPAAGGDRGQVFGLTASSAATVTASPAGTPLQNSAP